MAWRLPQSKLDTITRKVFQSLANYLLLADPVRVEVHPWMGLTDTDGTVEVVEPTGNAWAVYVRTTTDDAWWEVRVTLGSGTYDIHVGVWASASGDPAADLSVDGLVVGQVDHYKSGSNQARGEQLSDVKVLTDGIHTIRMAATTPGDETQTFALVFHRTAK